MKPIILKKADIIRIENTTKHLDEQKPSIFEFMLIDLFEKLLERKYGKKANNEWLFYLYTIHKLLKYNIENVNQELRRQLSIVINGIVAEFEPTVLMQAMVEQSYNLIEKNDYLLRYADESFNKLVELGFESAIRREWAWRESRGESLENLQAFAHMIEE